MKKKRIVIALGHDALGTTLPEQQAAIKRTAKAIAEFVKEDYHYSQQRTTGGDDSYGNGRVLPYLSGIYSNSNVGLLSYESGIYRIRFTERNPYGTVKPGNL